MNQHPVLGGNNGGPQQNESNSSRNSEVNTNPPQSTPPPTAVQRTTNRNIFHKTRLCYSFVEGNCHNGDSCKYAHGSEELRQPPPNWQKLQKDIETIGRMGICWKFNNGEECTYGERCGFLHENPANLQPTEVQTSVRRIVSEGQARPPNFLHENPTKLRGETAMEMRSKRSDNIVMKIPTVVSQQQRGFAKLWNKKLKGIYGDWINEEEDE